MNAYTSKPIRSLWLAFFVVLAASPAFTQSGPQPLLPLPEDGFGALTAWALPGPILLPPLPADGLNFWTLETPPWGSDWGDPARASANLNTAPSWDYAGTALSVDTNCPAYLQLNVADDQGTNITFDTGSISIWCQPNWTSVADSGAGPGNWATVWNIGAYTSNASVGCWLLTIDPSGSNLLFVAQSGGTNEVLRTPVDFDAGDWHNIVLTYTPTNCCLYLDGQLAASAGPITCGPSDSVCAADGFFVGSLSTAGESQFHGQLQYLVTYDYPLSANEVAGECAVVSSYIAHFSAAAVGGFHAADDDSGPPGMPDGGGDFSTNGEGTNLPPVCNLTIQTNGLWLSIISISNSTVFLDLNEATDYVYEIFSATNLNEPWNIETEVFPGTNTNAMPFTVDQAGRSNLFLAAMDWTGVTSSNNTTPDWWFYYWFGHLGLTDNDPDSAGYPLVNDYENRTDPNNTTFTVSLTNQYVNGSNVFLTLVVSAGLPYYMTTLVDSSNFTGASWVPFNSNLVANIGSTPGWHEIWVGARGLPANAQQTWMWTRVKLLTPPVLTLTNPASLTVMQPMIEVQGYCTNALASLTYALSNAAGVLTNQPAFIVGHYFDTNVFDFTTNMFQAFDVAVTNGDNTLTFCAVDRAGNITTTNITFTLDYSGKTNGPAIQLFWPQDGESVSGTEFTLRGSLDDFTASLSAQIVDASGDTNTVQGLVERNGLFWIEDAPLADGTNYITLTAMDANGHTTTTNLTVTNVPSAITIDDFSGSLGGDLRNVLSVVKGTMTLSNCTLWVNGVEAATNGDGTWEADSVPVGPGGTAVVEARAIPNSDSGVNGSGPAPATDGTPGNPTGIGSMAAQMQRDQPSAWYLQEYHYSGSFKIVTTRLYGTNTTVTSSTGNGAVDYEFMSHSTANSYCSSLGSSAFSWDCDLCPVTETGTDSSGDPSTNTSDIASALNAGQGFGGMPMAQWSWKAHSWEQYSPSANMTLTSTSDYSGSICTQTPLYIGGKGAPAKQNLYAINVSAASFPASTPIDVLASGACGQGVPPGGMTLLGQTPDNNGTIAAMLANNATIDGVPEVSPVNYTYYTGVEAIWTLNSLAVASNSASFDGTNWVAVVTSTNNWVYVEADPSTGDPTAGNDIIWTGGGEDVPGNPFQRQVSTTKLGPTTVTARLGSTTSNLNVLIVPPTLISLTVASNATQIGGTTNWGTVMTATNNWVYLQAALSPCDPGDATLIQWQGGQSVPGNPSQRQVTTTVSTNTTVTATLGTNSFSQTVWVIWATATIQTTGITPANAQELWTNIDPNNPILSDLSGRCPGNQLGVQMYTNQSFIYNGTNCLSAGIWAWAKECTIFTVRPAGIHAVLANNPGWVIRQNIMPHEFLDGAPSTTDYSDVWSDDSPNPWRCTSILDGADNLYTIDAPSIHQNLDGATNSYDVHDNWRVSLTLNGAICSDTNNYWHFEAGWKNGQSPPISPTNLGTGLISPLPTNSMYSTQ